MSGRLAAIIGAVAIINAVLVLPALRVRPLGDGASEPPGPIAGQMTR